MHSFKHRLMFIISGLWDLNMSFKLRSPPSSWSSDSDCGTDNWGVYCDFNSPMLVLGLLFGAESPDWLHEYLFSWKYLVD